MLLSSERPEGMRRRRKGWLEAAAEQGHLPACREIWQTSATEAGIKTSAKSIGTGDTCCRSRRLPG